MTSIGSVSFVSQILEKRSYVQTARNLSWAACIIAGVGALSATTKLTRDVAILAGVASLATAVYLSRRFQHFATSEKAIFDTTTGLMKIGLSEARRQYGYALDLSDLERWLMSDFSNRPPKEITQFHGEELKNFAGVQAAFVTLLETSTESASDLRAAWDEILIAHKFDESERKAFYSYPAAREAISKNDYSILQANGNLADVWKILGATQKDALKVVFLDHPQCNSDEPLLEITPEERAKHETHKRLIKKPLFDQKPNREIVEFVRGLAQHDPRFKVWREKALDESKDFAFRFSQYFEYFTAGILLGDQLKKRFFAEIKGWSFEKIISNYGLDWLDPQWGLVRKRDPEICPLVEEYLIGAMNLYVLVNQPNQTLSALEAHGYFPKELQDGIKLLSILFQETEAMICVLLFRPRSIKRFTPISMLYV
ncbi:MAG: hypothetical protein ABSA17_01515 [Rhabdochlamydiaceae bacterium]